MYIRSKLTLVYFYKRLNRIKVVRAITNRKNLIFDSKNHPAEHKSESFYSATVGLQQQKWAIFLDFSLLLLALSWYIISYNRIWFIRRLPGTVHLSIFMIVHNDHPWIWALVDSSSFFGYYYFSRSWFRLWMIIILGVRVAAERVAQICGPLWGAEVLHNFYLVFLFPAIFLLVTMLLQGLSWSWLDDTLFKKGNYKIFYW